MGPLGDGPGGAFSKGFQARVIMKLLLRLVRYCIFLPTFLFKADRHSSHGKRSRTRWTGGVCSPRMRRPTHSNHFPNFKS